jgi:superoxide dismutase, Fe-Mn family
MFTTEHLFLITLVTIGAGIERLETLGYQLPELGYDYDALEPAIDVQTMMLHHSKHHQAYIHQLNMALAPYRKLQDRTIEDLLMHIDEAPEEIRGVIRNSGGGHANHELYWKTIGPPSGDKPAGVLAEAIRQGFGTLESLQKELTEAAVKVFGSGWAFLAIDPRTRKMEVMSLPNQDVVILHGKSALLACDVWEHSYYLKYENRRLEYLKAFWDVVQWEAVSRRLESVLDQSLISAA